MSDLQQFIYDASKVLLWPVLVAVVLCLIWVLIELGAFLYELWLRFRYRDLEGLEGRALRARRAFADGKPRTAYRYLQENKYSPVVVRFLYDLIRNYQTERLAAKPLKLLQEYEYFTIRRLERTRILVRLGPILGLMGTLIPLSPALVGLANGDTQELADDLVTAFSVTVLGLLIGGLAFVISMVRDRMYSQDISDLEYLLELLEGSDQRLKSGRRLSKTGVWDADAAVVYDVGDGDAERVAPVALHEVPDEPLLPIAEPTGAPGAAPPAAEDAGAASQQIADTAVLTSLVPPPGAPGEPGLTFDDPQMDWTRDDDPFANLGPVDPEVPGGPSPNGGSGKLQRP